MNNEDLQPTTLLEAIRYFANPDTCLKFVAHLRWPEGPSCPRCTCHMVRFLATRQVWACKRCKKQFSVKVGTVFEDSPIGLDKWLCAIWLIVNAKNGVSSYEIHRSLGVTQKTAWFMAHRIRLALQRGSFQKKLSGHVEADETYIGGKARFMHATKRAQTRGISGKDVVMGLLERDGEVRLKVIETATSKALHSQIRKHVQKGSQLYTDEWRGYRGLSFDYAHRVINHAEKYVDGIIHTNGMENFWSLLKRGIRGTYVSVEPFHLFRYLDEQAFWFNARLGTDLDRFISAVSSIAGRRLTYQRLVGQTS